MSVEREPELDPYWNDDHPLGDIYVAGALRPVQARSHIEHDRFRGRGSETLFTLTEREGDYSYIQTRFYLTPVRHLDVRLADAQAWYYPTDRTLVLWELLLSPQYARQRDPREDLLLRQLWLRYEEFLGERYTGADQFLTTWEDEYDRDAWAGFLSAAGYRRTAPAVFRKARERHNEEVVGE